MKTVELKFIDGARLTANAKGEVVEYYDADGVKDTTIEEDGFPEVYGLWDEKTDGTVLWEDVVANPKGITPYFKGGSTLYLDNGDITNEGKVVDVLVKGKSILKR